MKKKLALILAAAMALSLLLCACGSGEKPGNSTQPGGDTEITGSYTIRLGTPTGGKHQQNVTMEEFKSRIEEASNGAITVELYPTSTLALRPR